MYYVKSSQKALGRLIKSYIDYCNESYKHPLTPVHPASV